MKNNDERGALEYNELDRDRVTKLLRNAIQLIHSGNDPTDRDRFDAAPSPMQSLYMAKSALPSQSEFTQQHQRGPIGPNTLLSTCHPQMPFRYGEDAHKTFYRSFPAARGTPNPGGRKRRFTSSNTKLSSSYFVPPTTWTREFFFSIKQLIIVHL